MTLLKRLKTLVISAFTALSLGVGPVMAAGTTPLSLVQQFDSSGTPLAGCLLYFYVAGTVATPQNAYSDFGLTNALPNPLQCDQSGRVPQHWLADGLIHIRLTNSSGVVQVDTTMQVLGPSSGGGGGGGTVDPTTILATGDVKVKYGTGALSGFVRLNGLTIGSATSGATERANADTQNLFVYLYNADPNLTVSGGRTGNALNDFNSNKKLTLPDARNRSIAALGDMGNTDAALFLGNTFTSGNSTTLGATIGIGTPKTLLQSDLPNVSPSVTGTSHNHTTTVAGGNGTISNTNTGIFLFASSFLQNFNITSSNTSSGGTVAINGGVTQTTFNTVSPLILVTLYIKL